MSALLAGLTESQRRCAEHGAGALLVVAGPGAGKTRTLVARLALLLERGQARPEELLAVTFTRKAAEEVRARLDGLIGSRARGITVGTFHAVCAGLLPPQGPILGESERLALLTCAAERARAPCDPRRLEKAVGRHHSGAAPIEDEALLDGLRRYEELKRQAGALDLDDLLLHARDALARGRVAPPWRFLSVDEYQDVSPVQRDLLRLLAGPPRNVLAIGDPDQAIYAFRGADVGCFFAFTQDFPGARVVQLSENFRSTQVIVRAAAAVIARNTRRAGGSMAARRGAGPLLIQREAASEAAEALGIVREIERLVGGTSLLSHARGRALAGEAAAFAFSDIAVLTRSAARADALAEALAREGLPLQRPRRRALSLEARRLFGLLRLAAAPAREAAALGRVLALASSMSEERLAALRALLGPLPLAERIVRAAESLGLPPGGDVVRAALLSAEREGARAFLSPIEAGDHEADELDLRCERISVLTLHGAKGLEFDVVFIAGCEAAELPGAGRGAEEIEEERRLFYVGMTRARERLYLSHARTGRRGDALPSPFLAEIPEELRAPPDRSAPRRRPRDPQRKLF